VPLWKRYFSMCCTEIFVCTTVLFRKIMLFKDLCSFLFISFLVISASLSFSNSLDTKTNMENSNAEFNNHSILLRFQGIILRVLGVSVCSVYNTNQFQTTFAPEGRKSKIQ
jgi:hypothetical protein